MNTVRVVLIGDTGAGKSSIVTRFTSGDFYEFQEPTIGAAFQVKSLTVNSRDVKIEIWDTAGQERYRSLTPMYYRKAQVALICYDSSNVNSFETAKTWYKQVTEKADENCVKIMVGNKSDIIDTVVVNNAIEFCQRKHIYHLTTSAKNDVNITKLFLLAAHKGVELGEYIPKLELNLKSDTYDKARYNYCCYQ